MKVPGNKSNARAAPGIPEDVLMLSRLMNMSFKWNRDKAVYYAIAKVGNAGSETEHVFEADPRRLPDDKDWMSLIGYIADFLKDKGYDQIEYKRKLSSIHQSGMLTADDVDIENTQPDETDEQTQQQA